jgi:activating signal cointegrator 1
MSTDPSAELVPSGEGELFGAQVERPPTLAAISLWQPHASLMFAFLDGVRVKPDETRHWPFPARLRGKWVVIHAAQRRVTRDEADSDLGDLCAKLFGPSWAKSLPYGAYLGCVRFGDALRMSEHGPLHDLDELCGYWTPSRWAWRTTDPRPLPEPIIAKGQQGFWEVRASLLKDTPPNAR